MQVLTAAEAEKDANIAERRISTDLTREVPPPANWAYKMEAEMWAYSENENIWVGLLLGVHIIGRMITLQTSDGTRRQTSNAFQVKPNYNSKDFNLNKFKAGENSSPLYQTYLTDILRPNDPRAWKCTDAKSKELDELMKNTT